MLSPPDAELARRDARLPGLALLLDAEAFAAALGRGLPHAGVGTVRIHYVRYKPGTSVLVGYEVETTGGIEWVHATAFGKDAHVRLPKAPHKVFPSPLGPGRLVLGVGADSCVVSLFPNDAKVKALRRLAVPTERRQLLRRLLPAESELWDRGFEILAYKPERRFVGRVGAPGAPRAVIKLYTSAGYLAARHGGQGLHSGHSLRVAPRLGRSDTRCALAWAWLPGQPAMEALSNPDRQLSAATTIGAALAELHLQSAEGLSHWRSADEAKALRALGNDLAALDPDSADRARSLVKRLAERLEQPALSRPIHGDFYARQVLLDGDTAGLLDFDEAVCGDPASDIANFAAHLMRSAWSGALDTRRIEPIEAGLLDGYRTVAPLPESAHVRWHTAVRLFRLAAEPFRKRETEWPAKMRAILDRVEEILGVPLRSCVVASSARVESGRADRHPRSEGRSIDPALPQLARALDPAEVEGHLRRLALFAGTRARVRAARLVRHRPGRRCLIEYDVEHDAAHGAGCSTIVGKMRSRGVDEKTLALVTSLSRAGFATDSADGISVPPPIGAIPELALWLQQKVPGEPATRQFGARTGAGLALRVAEAIHKLHETPMPCARRHTVADELRILSERLSGLALRRPDSSARLGRLLEACERLAASIPDEPLRGIHRDFYADHVIVAGQRLFLLDFDLFCDGDPALDVGNFIGHLIEGSLRTTGRPDGLAPVETALRERFLELSGSRRRRAIDAYTTLTLARHVEISTRFAERVPFSERLLDLCEERLDVAAGGRV